jgi:hypothetical protein
MNFTVLALRKLRGFLRNTEMLCPILLYVPGFRFVMDADRLSVVNNKDNHSQFIQSQGPSLAE